MKKLISLMFSIVFIISLSGCNKSENNIDVENIEINQDIVFINQYSNYAWGYQCYGSFIDKNGNAYKFDFSDDKISDDEKLEKMAEIMKTENPASNIFDGQSMKYMYSLLYKIDKNAGFDEESVACDAGQNTLYGVVYNEDSSAEFIQIYSNGDWEIKPLDPNAKKLCDYYQSAINKR